VLVSEMPGTTRDAIDAPLTWHRRRFRIVDTAGCGGPAAPRGGVLRWSAWRAKGDWRCADVVALVIDASRGRGPDAAIGEADRAV
jgi:GTP-binding protein